MAIIHLTNSTLSWHKTWAKVCKIKHKLKKIEIIYLTNSTLSWHKAWNFYRMKENLRESNVQICWNGVKSGGKTTVKDFSFSYHALWVW